MFSLSSLWTMVLDVIFPQKQLVKELEDTDPADFASRAGKPEGYAGKDILSCFDYRDPKVRQAIWELKYRGNKKIARLLATALYDELLAFLEEYASLKNFTDPLLIPIPLSRKREAERGFNQCRLLCDELVRLDSPFSKVSGIPPFLKEVADRPEDFSHYSRREDFSCGRNFTLSLTALQKTKDTPSQTKAGNRAERLKNLKGCFEAHREEVAGRNVILIDDVATTGGTIEEARRTLKAAGARQVIAFTVAH